MFNLALLAKTKEHGIHRVVCVVFPGYLQLARGHDPWMILIVLPKCSEVMPQAVATGRHIIEQLSVSTLVHSVSLPWTMWTGLMPIHIIIITTGTVNELTRCLVM